MALETKFGTSSAAAETDITWTGDYVTVEVVNRDAADEMFFTVDGTAVTAAAQNGCYYVPKVAGASCRVPLAPGQKTLKMWTTAATKYSVAPGIGGY